MRKVRILKPVAGYNVGDTPEVFGPRGRKLIAEGYAEWADERPREKVEAAPKARSLKPVGRGHADARAKR